MTKTFNLGFKCSNSIQNLPETKPIIHVSNKIIIKHTSFKWRIGAQIHKSAGRIITITSAKIYSAGNINVTKIYLYWLIFNMNPSLVLLGCKMVISIRSLITWVQFWWMSFLHARQLFSIGLLFFFLCDIMPHQFCFSLFSLLFIQ